MKIFFEKQFQEAFKNQKNIFDQIMSINGEVFRALENRKTLRFSRAGKSYFIKQHFGIGWKEFFKNLFQLRLPVLGAKNEWEAIQRLDELKISTMHLVAYGERGLNPAKKHSFIVTEELRDVESLEDICVHWSDCPPKYQYKLQLIKQVAHVARTLHQNGINHRDFYICHFLQDLKDKGENPKLYLIDLHRTQIRSKTPLRWIVKDIAGLYFSSMDIGLTNRDILRFLKEYFKKPLREILNKRNFLEKVEKRAVALYFKTFHRWPNLPLYFQSSPEKNVEKELYEQVREINYFKSLNYASSHQFMLNVKDGFFYSENILRIIPKKRIVVKGIWQGKSVVAKIFFGERAKQHLEKEIKGIGLLMKTDVSIPGVCLQGKTDINGVYIVLFEYIEPVTDVNSVWKGGDEQLLKSFLIKSQEIISILHKHGLYYADLHPANFLIGKENLYMLDAADIVCEKEMKELNREKSIDNISILYVQLYLKYQSLIEDLFNHYCDLRQWENNEVLKSDLFLKLNKLRYRRIDETISRCSRNCTDIKVIKSFKKYIACHREVYQEDIKKFIKNPDSYIAQGEIVKKGNTCTGAKIILNDKTYFVKRYNVKGFVHLLKVCARKSRAIKSWQNAHVLDILGINTPRPVAVIENRFGFLHGKTYFLSEYVEGELLRDYMVNQWHSMPDKTVVAQNVVNVLKLLSLVNITHRDTKFTNYFIQGEIIVILDLDAMTLYKSRKTFLKAFEKDKKRLLLNWEDNKTIYDLFEKELKSRVEG